MEKIDTDYNDELEKFRPNVSRCSICDEVIAFRQRSVQKKMARLGIYHTQIRPKIQPYQVSDLISQDTCTKITDTCHWLLANYSKRKTKGLLEQAPSYFSEVQEAVAGSLQQQAPAVIEEPDEY